MPATESSVIGAIIPAAGIGTRMGGDIPKQFLEVGNLPILVQTVSRFLQVSSIQHIIIPLPEEYREAAEKILHNYFSSDQCKQLTCVTGGKTRQDSVWHGLEALPAETDFVLVHDGARPFVKSRTIEKCLAAGIKHGAAIVAVPVRDTIKKVNAAGEIEETVDRELLWHAQTPQGASTQLFKKAYAIAKKDGFVGTDEASLLEHAGISVHVVEGSEENIKITRPDDLKLAARMSKESDMIRVGHGFDAHRFVIGRHLVLGGVDIPFDLGLEGHSDADVVVHALIDALLGALAAGDIGRLFPDNDPQYKDISSLKLLEEVVRMVQEKQYIISNADITIICQRPKLSPHVEEMCTNLAETCFVSSGDINIKATTTEMMGYTGRGEGIAVHAVVLIKKK